MSEGENHVEKGETALDPELDSLLDDALQDFTKPQPSALSQPVNVDLASAMAAFGISAATGGKEEAQNVWTEEFIQQATANFEKTMRALMEQQQGNLPSDSGAQVQKTEKDQSPSETSPTSAPAAGSGSAANEIPEGSIDFSAMSADFAKFAQAAAKAAAEAPSDAPFTDCLSETMKQLSQNNEQLKSVPTAEDMTKMFESLGFGGGEGEEGGFGGLFPLMQVMLENILSKEVLYPPMKEITDKYPDWLADHRSSLPEDEYERYNKQYDVMKQVVQLYEEEQDSDSDEVKGQRFEKIMQFMQKLQEMGQPPKDLVGDLGPMINFDESGNPVLPDMSTLLGAAGFPGGDAGVPTEPAPGGVPGNQPQEGEQCHIM